MRSILSKVDVLACLYDLWVGGLSWVGVGRHFLSQLHSRVSVVTGVHLLSLCVPLVRGVASVLLWVDRSGISVLINKVTRALMCILAHR